MWCILCGVYCVFPKINKTLQKSALYVSNNKNPTKTKKTFLSRDREDD